MITIAIPTYRRGPILVETLERLLALTPRADEIVVVDQTKEYPPEIAARLEAWSKNEIRWIRLPEPSIPHAMNEALRAASHRVVLFVDDDIIPSSTLAQEHERAYRDPGVWAVVGQVMQPGEEAGHFDENAIHRGTLPDLEFRFNHDVAGDVENVIACNLSVDRTKALAIGGFDENFIAGAYRFETDFARRVVNAGGRVRFEPRASIHHLHVPTGGVRAYGDHRRTSSPSHSAGDYYFALWHVRPFWPYALRRFRSNIATRWHLRHPWFIPAKIASEVRGYAMARRLYRRGRRLAE